MLFCFCTFFSVMQNSNGCVHTHKWSNNKSDMDRTLKHNLCAYRYKLFPPVITINIFPVDTAL